MDLCEAFSAADIPICKLSNPILRSFLKKYTKEIIPEESTLRKHYVDKIYNSLIEKIKIDLKNKYLWVSVDETIDIQGRFVANVIVGVLDQNEEESKKKFLINVVQLEKTNHETIARAFNDSIISLELDTNKILLFLTDAAPYMIKAARGLKLFYPKLLHVTCIAHGMHRVAEEIRRHFRNVDGLISNGKKIFLKAPSRVELFKEKYPSAPLPPQPIVTRWGTWLKAVEYYTKTYEAFKTTVNGFDESDAIAIQNAK